MLNHPRHLCSNNIPILLQLKDIFSSDFEDMTLESTSAKFSFISDFFHYKGSNLKEKVVILSGF